MPELTIDQLGDICLAFGIIALVCLIVGRIVERNQHKPPQG